MSEGAPLNYVVKDLLAFLVAKVDHKRVLALSKEIDEQAGILLKVLDRAAATEDPLTIYYARHGVLHLLEYGKALLEGSMQRMNTKSRLVVLDTGKDR